MNSAHRTRLVCSLASGLAVAWLALAGFAQETASVATVLREVARLHATNQEAIVTWQGRGIWSASGDSAGSAATAAARLQFALDRRIDRQTYRLDPLPAAPSGVADRPQPATPALDSAQGGLLTAQWVFHSRERGADPRDPRWQIDDAQRFQFSPEQRTFFPEMLVACGERPAADLWQLLLPADPAAQSSASVAAGEVQVTQEGSLVRITKTNPILREQVTVWTFDRAQGAQLVRLAQAGPHWGTEWDYAYAPVAGVWLPKSIRFSVKLPAAAANLPPGDPALVPPRAWELQIETESLNQVDVAERLQAEFLPLAGGDLILDLRSGERFQLGSATRPSRDPLASAETVAAGATPTWRWLLVGGGLLLLAVGLVVNVWSARAGRAESRRAPWPWGAVGIACASLALVAAAAWQRSHELRQVAVLESQRTQSGHRCLFRLLRRQGIPSAMDAVLEKLPPAREPELAEMIAYLQGVGLRAVSRELPFDQREQLRTPAIVPVAAPRQYLFVDRAPSGELIAFDLNAGRGLCDVATLAQRWQSPVLEIEPDAQFLFRPERRNQPAPAIQFASMFQDQGPLPPVRSIVYHFPFSNQGQAPLVLGTVYPDCSCLSVDIPETTIPPGGQGEVRVVYDLRKRKSAGEFQFNITLESNDPVIPYSTLTIAGNNDPQLTLVPDRLEFAGPTVGEAGAREVLVTFRGEAVRQGEILSATSPLSELPVVALPARAGEELAFLGLADLHPVRPGGNRWLLRVQPSAAAGRELASVSPLRVATNLTGYRELSLPLVGRLAGGPAAYPPRLVWSESFTDLASPWSVWLAAAPDQPFRIVAVEGGEANLQVSFDGTAVASIHRIAVQPVLARDGADWSQPVTCTATLAAADGSTQQVRWEVIQAARWPNQ